MCERGLKLGIFWEWCRRLSLRIGCFVKVKVTVTTSAHKIAHVLYIAVYVYARRENVKRRLRQSLGRVSVVIDGSFGLSNYRAGLRHTYLHTGWYMSEPYRRNRSVR